MKRATAPQQGISLFPFLAVLLCTMGALIVLLVVINRNSRRQGLASRAQALAKQNSSPAESVQPSPAPIPALSSSAAAGDKATLQRDLAKLDTQLEAARDAVETLNWRVGHLQTTRDKSAEDVRQERLRLGSAEELLRAAEQQTRELSRALRELTPQAASRQLNRQELSAQLTAAQREFQLLREKIAAKQQQAAAATPKFSVVPYDGPNRTNRRPIYIECTAERIILQPEGITLTARDFVGPLGPGNPLAATVRAIRDELVAQAPPNQPATEPYPLFLIRPDGIAAYYLAREAMSSYAHEIGYQAVDQEWELAYPPADAAVQQRATQALATARNLYQQYVQAHPGQAADQAKVAYRVSPVTGGLVPAQGGLGETLRPRATRPTGGGPGGGGNTGLVGNNGGNSVNGVSDAGGGINAPLTRLSPTNPGQQLLGTHPALAGASGVDSTTPEPWRITRGEGNANRGGTGMSAGSGLNAGSGTGPGSGNGLSGTGNGANGANGLRGTGNEPGEPGANNGGSGLLANTNNFTGSAQPGQNPANLTVNSSTGSNSPPGTTAGNQPAGNITSNSAASSRQNNSPGGGNLPYGNAVADAGQATATNRASPNGSNGTGRNGSAAKGSGTTTNGATGDTANASANGGSAGSGADGPPSGGTSFESLAGISTSGGGTPNAPSEQPFRRTADRERQNAKPNQETRSLADTRGNNWGLKHARQDAQPLIRPLGVQITDKQLILAADPAADDPQKVIPMVGATDESIREFTAAVEQRIKKWGLAGHRLYWSPELKVTVDPAGEERYAEFVRLLERSGWAITRKNPTNGISIPATATAPVTTPVFPQR
ncbi:MAG: hypothetical protein SFX18_11655 [Pirellulales bacterium]|nr:hypothetical protein [Pirellulales bacterium]